jgi:hypothetical protein
MSAGSPSNDRALAWVAGLSSLALFLPLAWPLVNGRVFIFDDLGNFHIPLRYLYANALRAGHLLIWTPAVFGGLYLHGEGQLGMLHPGHVLLYRFLPLTIAFNLEFLATYVFAFSGMYWFLKRLRLSLAGALFGAMLFAFSGFQLLHHVHINLVAVTAHLPWLLGCIDLVISGDRSTERRAGYAGGALVLASELLVGFPQAVWWSLLTGSAFAIFRAAETSRWRRLVPCALAALTGVAVGAIQWLPTLAAAAHSIRSLYPASFALTYSLSPWNLVQLWSPYFFVNRAYSASDYLQVHELGIYSSTIAAVAPLWLFGRRHALGDRRPLVLAAGGFALVMFVLALGRYGGLDVLLAQLPGLRSLRAPVRYIVLVQFALSVLAALALDDLAAVRAADRLGPRQTVALCSIAILSVLTTALVNTHAIRLPAAIPVAPFTQAAGGTALVLAVTFVFVLAARHVPWAPAALIAITAADLGFWGIGYVYRQPPHRIDVLTFGIPPAPRGGPTRVAVPGRWADRLVLKDYQIVPGYLGLYPATENATDSTAFLRLAGVRRTVADDGTMTAVEEPVPRARMLGTEARSERRAPACAVCSVAVIRDEPGDIVVRTASTAPAILALTERFDEGWQTTADGAAVETVRVRGDFLGAHVDAGSHRVEFRFKPRSLALGAELSALAFVLLIPGTIAAGRRFQPPAAHVTRGGLPRSKSQTEDS